VQLWDAAMRGDTSALRDALAQGAKVDSLDVRRSANGRRALNWAAWYNRSQAIRFLLAHGADVNAANLTGFTPLHHAAENGSVEAARALLEAGADPRAPNYLGQTPADVARSHDHLEVAAVIDSSRS
jgi:ankyrin repeat protein